VTQTKKTVAKNKRFSCIRIDLFSSCICEQSDVKLCEAHGLAGYLAR